MTQKQKKFCLEYLIDCNATQAAIRSGYSEKTARQIGDENLSKPYIKEYIEKMLEEVKSKKIADIEEVMEYLTSVMRREKKETVVVTITKEQSEYLPDVNGIMRRKTIKEEVPECVEIPAKLSDSNKAAEMLGRRYGLFKDNVLLESIIPIFSGENELEE